MTDRVGQQLGNYRLVRLLGQGSFAEVYLGEHRYLQNQAAIKVLSTSLQDEDVNSFRQEAQTIARLLHPRIVRVLDFDVKDDIPFLVMEYAPGGSLRQLHPRSTIVPPETITLYVQQISEALHYAHSQRIVHRDIKPENILLNQAGSLLLTDFGIAVFGQSVLVTQALFEVAGTTAYMAPEQFQGRAFLASDQYALGIMVYEWLCGKRPFHGSFLEIAQQKMHDAPPPLSQKAAAIAPAMEEVVMAALDRDPRRRFPSIKAFADAWTQACLRNTNFGTTASNSLQESDALPPSNLAQQIENMTAGPPERSQPAGKLPDLENSLSAPMMQASLPPGSMQSAAIPLQMDDQIENRPTQLLGAVRPTRAAGGPDRPQAKGLSRRTLLWGAAGLATLAATAGGVIWWQASQRGWQQSINSSGAMFGFDLQHSHINPHETMLSAQNVSRLQIDWLVNTDNAINASPVVANGVVYIGSKDYNLYAFDAASGKVIWSFPTKDRIDSSVAVANGVVYCGSYDHYLYAIDSTTGKLKWAAPTADSIYSSSPAVANGIVYVGSRDHNLYAFDASSGQRLWSFSTNDVITSSPAIADGVVYIGSYDHNLYAVDAVTGKLRLQYPTNDVVSSSAAIFNGVVYIGSEDHNLYAFEIATGKKIWTAHTHSGVISAPAIANGVVYVGSYDTHIYAFDAATGIMRWQVPTNGIVSSSPTVANNLIYIGSKDNNLYVLDAFSGQILAKLPTGGAIISSPTVANGIVYVGSEDNKLYAFHLPG